MSRFGLGMVALVLLLCAGCDGDRTAQLEKEIAELKAKINQQDTARNFDLKEKCSTAARAWFNGNWASTSHDKDTITLDFIDHYNAKFNSCLIIVEYHYNSHLAGPGGQSWTKIINMYDVHENSKYADFSENHYTYIKPPNISNNEEVITCDVEGRKCKTAGEFNDLTRPYMTD